MNSKQIEDKFLLADQKCLICIDGRIVDSFSNPRQMYIALIEREDDHGLFIFTVSKYPNPSVDDLDIDKVIPVDADLRTVTENPDKSQLQDYYVLHLKSKFINSQITLLDNQSSKTFLEELERTQSGKLKATTRNSKL